MREFERCVTREEIAAARIEMRDWYSRYTESELCASLAAAAEAPGLTVGLERLRAAGVQIAIASITWSFAVEWFARRLGAQFHLGTELRPGGAVVHVWPEDKAAWLSDLAARLGIPRAETAAVGDTTSDLPMLLAAGRAYYVGIDEPPAPGIRHFPSGDIDQIARELLCSDSAPEGAPELKRTSASQIERKGTS